MKNEDIIQKYIDGLVINGSFNNLENMIDSINDVAIELIDQKWAIEDHLLDPLISKMDNILSSLNKSGTLYKGNDYGIKNLEEWAWYKDSGIGNIHYLNENTFYVDGDKRSIFSSGKYLLIKCSAGEIPRRVESVKLSGSDTYIHLSTKSEDDLWDNPYYDKNKATYPTCVNPNISVSKCDCYILTDEPYTTTSSTKPEYISGMFRIIISPIAENIEKYVVFINISESSGINNENLSEVFDEIGEDWRKLYIYNEDETEILYTEVDYWEPENKRGALYVNVPYIEANKQTVLICRYGINLPNNDEYIWQLYTDYPHGYYDTNWDYNHISNGVWSRSQESNKKGYMSNMNFGCVNNYCTEYEPNDYNIKLLMDVNINFPGSMHTTRHLSDFNNLIERGYNNIRNAISNKDIIVNWSDGHFFNDPIKEYFSLSSYSSTWSYGWTTEYFFKRKTFFNQQETTQEERDEYEALGIAGYPPYNGNGPKDEFLVMYHHGTQFEPHCIYWNADNGKLVFRFSNQYGSTPAYYFESNKTSWSNDWYHVVYDYDKINTNFKLYINGELDKEDNNAYDNLYSPIYNKAGVKYRAPGWTSEYRYDNWCFLTFDNFKILPYPISQERIKADYLDLKDELIYYERVIAPS